LLLKSLLDCCKGISIRTSKKKRKEKKNNL